MTETGPQPCDLLVGGDLVLTLDEQGRILRNGALAVSGGRIVDIGPAAAL